MNSRIASLRARLPRKGGFIANILTLMSGSTMSHVILIAASPVLTRLYDPKDFGLWALFYSLTIILAGISSWRYEFAIMLPKENRDAANILALCLIIVALMSGLGFLLVAFFGKSIAQLLKSPDLAPWLWLAPLVIFLTGLFNSLNYWSTRNKKFQELAVSKVSASLGTVGAQLGSGAASVGTAGLIAGQVFGQTVGTGVLAKQIWNADGKLILSSLSKSNIIGQAKRHKKFPLFLLISTLAQSMARQIPVWFIASSFGVQNAGFYALAYRTIALPIPLIGQSVAQVFYQRATEVKNQTGTSYKLVRKVALVLALIPALPFIILMLWGPEIFALIFGKQWATAGRFAAILCPMSWCSFVIGPLTMILAVYEYQEIELISNIALLAFAFSAFYISTEFHFTLDRVLLCYSAVIVLWYLLNLTMLIRISKGKPFFYKLKSKG